MPTPDLRDRLDAPLLVALVAALVGALAANGPWVGVPDQPLEWGWAHQGWIASLLLVGGAVILALVIHPRLGPGLSAALFLAALVFLAPKAWNILSGDARMLGAPLAVGASFTALCAAVGMFVRRGGTWWAETALLGNLAALMFWVRMLPYEALLGRDRAYYIGTDPFYHFRETLGIVRSFPNVPRWDPFTFYPIGTATGQFGSLFDWTAAAFIVLTKGRDAPETYVATVVGVFPAVMGALLVIPFYFLARRLLGRAGAVVAAITLAFLPGEFLIRSVAGYADHHVAEAFFATISILGVLVAVERGHAARAALAGWRDDPKALLWPVLWGVLGGLALAANFYAWPPAILFGGILAVWLTVAIVLENAREDGDAGGMVLGAATAFLVAALATVPSIETTFLGEFNTYGILQPLFCLGAALWIVAVHAASRWTAHRGLSAWIVPGAIAGLTVLGFVATRILLPTVYGSLRWGLSWITGVGVPRTTTTIAEARPADFFCSGDSAEASCLSSDFGLVAPFTFLVLLALLVFVLIKRRRSDILLLIWSLVIFRATDTQIRFSYYLALNMALLLGWLAARVAEGTGLEGADVEERPATPLSAKAAKAAKGRKTRRAEVTAKSSRPLQIAAVAAVLVILLPGNVIATERAQPGWKTADIRGADPELAIWLEGLDWMRQNTPDAGVDLGLVVERPPVGERYQYPPEAYGVLSWWDYGHWIQSVGLRPPVANPFQQAAPFASLWFTERDPAQADRMLAEWTEGAGPVRYVVIDDEMATGKFHAITVWASSHNLTRPRWPDGAFNEQRQFDANGRPLTLYGVGPAYTESMMGRLYDADGNGLPNYRLVWEHRDYTGVGNIAESNGNVRCFHDAIPSRGCGYSVPVEVFTGYREGEATDLGGDLFGYDLSIQSRLKVFERVEGARLTGTTLPYSQVLAYVDLLIEQPNGATRSFAHSVVGSAGPDGAFEIVFPYASTDFLGPDEGGTNSLVKASGPVTVLTPNNRTTVDVPDAAVLRGETVPVRFA